MVDTAYYSKIYYKLQVAYGSGGCRLGYTKNNALPQSTERTTGMVLHAVQFAPDPVITGPLPNDAVLAARLKDGSVYYLRYSPREYSKLVRRRFWLDWEIAAEYQRITPDMDTILGQLRATPRDWEKFTTKGILLPVGVPLRRGLPLAVRICRRPQSLPLEISKSPLETLTLANRVSVLERMEHSLLR